MAIVGPHEASSSASQCDHDVFLSFRGEDTRTTFTDHLYAALISAGFQTFRDNEGIERGENINSELQQAIQHSKIYIVVISENYASSTWCLDELVLILHCKKTSGNVVVPLFYHVDPSDVRKQNGSFEEAFKVHEGKTERTSKLEGWRSALREVSNLAGMELPREAHVHESDFIQKVVKVVQDKLRRTPLNVDPYLIGVYTSIKRISKWLLDESTKAHILIIHGMGGIGKTTIAKCLYNINYQRFEGSSFLANVRGYSETSDGLARLQQNLLSDILRGRKEDIRDVDEGIIKIKNALCHKKILLVLDDVDQTDQLDAILGTQNWLCRRSKVILTTRNYRLLKPPHVYDVHEVERLYNYESLQLFSLHAFGQNYPIDGFMDISIRVVNYCGGLPLALLVLGRYLSGRRLDIWESAVQKLEAIPNSEIVNKLKISYDGLPDSHDKSLFLDIACFCIGEDKDKVISVLDFCGYYTKVGLENFIDRCLLTINKDNKISMHQLLQEMGREIVRQESLEPEKRTRLCHHNDCIQVLRQKTGTEKIIGVSLSLFVSAGKNQAEASMSRKQDISSIGVEGSSSKGIRFSLFSWLYASISSSSPRESGCLSDEIDFETNAFARMHKLKLFKFDNVHLVGEYKHLPQELRWMHWHRFNLESLPDGFPMKNLVCLDMQHSRLKHVWKGKKLLGNLKFLDLSYSPFLESTPDFSGVPNLERLSLRYCIQLTEIHGSIGKLRTLLSLDLEGCRNLEKLPKTVNELKSLEKLILAGCSKLNDFPFDLQKLDRLTLFNADGVSFSSQRSKTRETKSLGPDSKKDEINLEEPFKISLTSFCSSLEKLSLADCNLSDDDLPKDLRCLSSLRSLNLKGNIFSTLPESIKNLTKLQELEVDGCKMLRSIPPLPSSLTHVNMRNCKSLIVVDEDGQSVLLFDNWRLNEGSQFKLGPIQDIDAEVINSLGLLNTESIINVNVKLLNRIGHGQGKVPIQGLYEFGIYSIFFPRSEVPDWFSYKTQGSSLCFDVPCISDDKVAVLSICTVYTWLEKSRYDPEESLCVTVRNNSKDLKWTYPPTYIGSRGDDEEDMTWLCHWDFGGKIESHDNVEILGLVMNYMQVKEIGVHVTYKDCQSIAGGADLSTYEVVPGAYLLEHRQCTLKAQGPTC